MQRAADTNNAAQVTDNISNNKCQTEALMIAVMKCII